MKGFLILMVVGFFSVGAFAQQDKDSLKIEREKHYQDWLVIHDSLLSDTLFNSYFDFRTDTNGKLGFRFKYFESRDIPFEGLSKKRILEFLGKPNSIDSNKYKGDSIQTIIFTYNIGTVEDPISEEEHKNGVLKSGKSYLLQIRIKNNRASGDLMDMFNAYHTTWYNSNW